MVFDPDNHEGESDYLKRSDVQGHLQVLAVLREWDPIGVDPNNTPDAFDEYDPYSAWVVKMLDQDATAEDIAAGLRQVAVEHMGLSHYNDSTALQLVSELKIWWKQWKASNPD